MTGWLIFPLHILVSGNAFTCAKNKKKKTITQDTLFIQLGYHFRYNIEGPSYQVCVVGYFSLQKIKIIAAICIVLFLYLQTIVELTLVVPPPLKVLLLLPFVVFALLVFVKLQQHRRHQLQPCVLQQLVLYNRLYNTVAYEIVGLIL